MCGEAEAEMIWANIFVLLCIIVGPDATLNDPHEAYIVPAAVPQTGGRSTYEALAQHDGSLANLAAALTSVWPCIPAAGCYSQPSITLRRFDNDE